MDAARCRCPWSPPGAGVAARADGYAERMPHDGSDQVGHGEASLGEAQATNPPDDPEMIEPDAPPLDSDTDFEGEGPPPEEPRGNDDPAPNAP